MKGSPLRDFHQLLPLDSFLCLFPEFQPLGEDIDYVTRLLRLAMRIGHRSWGGSWYLVLCTRMLHGQS